MFFYTNTKGRENFTLKHKTYKVTKNRNIKILVIDTKPRKYVTEGKGGDKK